MPLTPLGRQLRSILAGLRNFTRPGDFRAPLRPTSSLNDAPPNTDPGRGSYAHARPCRIGGIRRYNAATAFATPADSVALKTCDSETSGTYECDTEVVKTSSTEGRRTRLESEQSVFGASPTAAGYDAALEEEVDAFGFARDRRRARSGARTLRIGLPEETDKIASSRSEEISLSHMVLGRVRASKRGESGRARFHGLPVQPFQPTPTERDILSNTYHTKHDVDEWTRMLQTSDSLESATLLTEKTQASGPASTPIFVLLYLLGREYISSRALRMLIKQAERIFKSRTGEQLADNKGLFVAFVRLLRHARKVSPASLDRITRLLLENLSSATCEDSDPDPEQLEGLTRRLNDALRLIVVPTAIEPFKNNPHQEAALVRVLQFMANHRPTLQISRVGYRAVAILQLAQRKTEKEQEWAELKTLSWPPWREDRTAMDSFVTADNHGISKAAGTLLRMREAGYRPKGWEETAMIYAGWDIDGTPTIQTLTLFGMDGERFRTGTARWAARITTTRTVQEAWAAFLAFEDRQRGKGHPPDQEVHLAIIAKLQKEDVRRRQAVRAATRAVGSRPEEEVFKPWRVFPGDVREVSPLPPSMHLHTYTRSTPPSMDGFYRHMHKVDFPPHGHCLAFLVANAPNIHLGKEYLKDSGYEEDVPRSLIDLDQQYDIEKVPLPLFDAFIQLLSRFSKVPMSLPARDYNAPDSNPQKRPDVLQSRLLTKHVAIVHATALLQWRRPLHLPPYNAVLMSIGHGSSHQNLRSVEGPDVPFYMRDISATSEAEQERERLRGAVTAYRLGRRVVSLMREVHLDLDIDGFRALCHIAENAAIATWSILADAEGQHDHASSRPTTYFREAARWSRSTSHAMRLRGEFRILIGDDSISDGTVDGRPADVELAPLEVPSFSLLHPYVRALGWMGDHDGLLETLRWMVAHASALATRQKQDRNGAVMRFRVLCAFRAFLERSWLPAQSMGVATVQDATTDERPGEQAGSRPALVKLLRRLRSPAPDKVIEEARRLVESVDQWDGWPSDAEVEQYCANKRFGQLGGSRAAASA